MKLPAVLANPALIYLGASVLARAGSFLLVPLYTRRLSPSEYGSYASFTTLLPLLVTLCSLGLSSAVTRSFYSPRNGLRPAQAVGDVGRGMLAIGVASALLGSLLITVLLPGGAMQLDRSQWFLLLWTTVAATLATVPDVYLTVSQQAWKVAALQITSFLMTASFGLLFVLGLGRGGRGAIEALAMSSTLQGLFSLWFIWRRLEHAEPVETIRTELKTSLPYVPHTLALWVQQVGDRAILSAQGYADMLGIYYLAVQLSTPIGLVITAWNNARVPVLGEAFRERGREAASRVLPSQYLQYGAVSLVTALAMLLGTPLLPWVVGARFAGAIALLPALLGVAVLESLYLPSVNYLMIIGYSRLIPVATALASFVSVGLVVVLLPRYGVNGLLVARLLGALARAAFMRLLVAWHQHRDRGAEPTPAA